MSKNTRGILLLTGAAVIWGFAFVAQRQGAEEIPPFTFTAVRAAIGAFVLVCTWLIQTAYRKKNGTFSREKTLISLKGGLIAGLFMCAATNLQQIALMTVSAGKSGFLTALYIVIVPVLGFFFMKRRVKLKVWLAVLIAFISLYLITGADLKSMERGDYFLVGCACMFALQILTLSVVSPDGDPVLITAVEFLLTAAMSAIPALLFETTPPGAFEAALIPLLYTGVLSSAVAYGLQTAGQAYAQPESASIAMSLESVFAAIGGALILGESMTVTELAGCALMFLAVLLSG